MPEICLVIPCYNEAGRLPSEAIVSFVQGHGDCTICFVNDGSIDGTAQVLASLRDRVPGRILVVALPRNSGKAEAVRRGVLETAATGRFDLIGYWDADLATPLEQVRAMQDALANNPACVLAMGSRLRRMGSRIDRSGVRHVLGRVFATAASLVLGLPIYDSQCGAKLFRAPAAEWLFGEPFISTWLFDVEVLARLRNHFGPREVLGAALEVPLTEWREVGGSKLRFAAMTAVPLDLLKIHRRYNSK